MELADLEVVTVDLIEALSNSVRNVVAAETACDASTET
jgi:hypothetical protein